VTSGSLTDSQLSRLTTALADRYLLEREVGAGGMATVWRAEDVRHHRPVAIKVLHPELSAVLGPEYYDGRELVVHADADAAVEAMTEIRRAARTCRRSGNQVWTVLARDTGYDTVTMGLTYDDGLGSSVFQVTRVGSARLMVQTYGEGTLASLDRQADEVTGTTNQIVRSMCAFTKTGC
jgi:serine/threonine protein kinase